MTRMDLTHEIGGLIPPIEGFGGGGNGGYVREDLAGWVLTEEVVMLGTLSILAEIHGLSYA
ncbi:hypothetical protein Syun_027251 [Stephania yunnanensis]|uniref:Uncharacterized protein n=1 Tax=Stephania yunnanensis TaxID=152371 RepID=A0AAP0HR44_9MAGN